MAKAHDIGRLYMQWFVADLRGAPLIHASWTNEIEWPYREGTGVVVRLGRRHALVLGLWKAVQRSEEAGEDEALMVALNASSPWYPPEEEEWDS